MSLDIVCGNKQNQDLNNIICAFVALHIWQHGNDFGPCGSIGVISNEKLIAGVVFHNWHEEYGIIELSAAAISPRWLTRTVIRLIMSVCFYQHGCQQIVSRVSVDNERALKIYRFLGFSEMLLPNMRGTGKHEILFLMTSDEWKSNKLNEDKHGQT